MRHREKLGTEGDHLLGAESTLVERWNGRKWIKLPSSYPDGHGLDYILSAIGATSCSDAWAVGSAFVLGSPNTRRPLAIHC